MSDNADTAFDIEHNQMEAALAARAQRSMPTSASHCDECGDPIPAARRHAVPGCKQCTYCAGVKEQSELYRARRVR